MILHRKFYDCTCVKFIHFSRKNSFDSIISHFFFSPFHSTLFWGWMTFNDGISNLWNCYWFFLLLLHLFVCFVCFQFKVWYMCLIFFLFFLSLVTGWNPMIQYKYVICYNQEKHCHENKKKTRNIEICVIKLLKANVTTLFVSMIKSKHIHTRADTVTYS